jgi:hypothetical protein
MDNQTPDRYLTLITKFGSELYKRIVFILLVSIGIWLANEFFVKAEKKDKNNNQRFRIARIEGTKNDFIIREESNKDSENDSRFSCYNENSIACKILPFSAIIELISSSLITSMMTLIAVEVLLKKQALEEIEERVVQQTTKIEGILNYIEAGKYVDKAYIDMQSQKEDIKKSIRDLNGTETIRMLCSSDMIEVFREIGYDCLLEKLKQGCIFEILTLDPSHSKILFLDRKIPELGDLQKSKMKTNFDIFRELKTKAENAIFPRNQLRGVLTVKTYTDLYFPSSYFSIESKDKSKNVTLLSTPCFESESFVHPGFTTSHESLVDKAKAHFYTQWEASTNQESYQIKNTIS